LTRSPLLLAFLLVACGQTPPSATATAAPKLTSQAADRGQALYSTYCATCHGAHEEGYAADNAPSLASSTFLDTVTPTFLRAAIERGRPGTAMAGFAQDVGGPLSRLQVDQLMAFLMREAPKSTLNVPPPPGNAANGRALYDAQCATCHGTPQQRATALHLANPAFLASASDSFLLAAITRGRPGTRMQPWLGKLRLPEIADVVAYLRSLARPVPPPVLAAPAATPDPFPQPATLPGPEKALPVTGPVVLNPHGRKPDFTLKDDLYVPVAGVGQAFKEERRLVVIDARPPSDYLRMHIKGAISVPFYDMKGLDRVPNDGTWVVAYCACPHHVSGIVVAELRKRGYKHTAVLDEGIFAWQQAGYPVTAAPNQLPVAAPPPPVATIRP
jgi:mono/diheme cytochrome c family protein/rhodanese-related sulfurtransferase